MFAMKSVGRFAPPAARYPGILASDPANPFDVPVTGYWRWTGIGNRGMHYVDQATDFVAEVTIDVSENIELRVGTQVNKFYGTDIGRYYLDYAGLDFKHLLTKLLLDLQTVCMLCLLRQ